MPKLTVTAHDTETAMDKVTARLGEDAYILSTQTINGQIVINATDELADIDIPAKPSIIDVDIPSRQPRFGEIFSAHTDQKAGTSQDMRKENIEKEEREEKPGKKIMDIHMPSSQTDIAMLRDEIVELRALLQDMIITSTDGVNAVIGTTPALMLRQMQISPSLIHRLQDSFINHGPEKGRQLFMQKLSTLLAMQTPETLIDKKYIFVLGHAGSGKTNLIKNIATDIMSKRPLQFLSLVSTNYNNHALAQIARNKKSEHLALDQKMLLNHVHESLADDMGALHNLVEICLPLSQTGFFVKHVQEKYGQDKTAFILCLPASSNMRAIRQPLYQFQGHIPLIAFTKTDECPLTATELSVAAEYGAHIALLGEEKTAYLSKQADLLDILMAHH